MGQSWRAVDQIPVEREPGDGFGLALIADVKTTREPTEPSATRLHWPSAPMRLEGSARWLVLHPMETSVDQIDNSSTNPQTFDADTAYPYCARVAGRHDAYVDARRSLCLVCKGRTQRGGVAINEGALRWLEAWRGGRFVRLINPVSGFDVTISLENLPRGEVRGHGDGAYMFVDPADVTCPPFPPPLGGGNPDDAPF